jgi:hypothetical protein
MKKLFVQMLRALVCAGSIAAAAAATPSGTLGIVVDSSNVWLGPWWSGQNGGTLSEGLFYSSGSKLVVRGTFAQVFATQNGSSSVLNVFRDTDLVNPVSTIPVSGLSYSGTSATNVFILELNGGGTSMTFRSMNGGLTGYNGGVVSAMSVWEANDKILFVGDFGSGLSTTYQDFRIWDIGNAAWDTYTMVLAGYDGYWPSLIVQESPDTFYVELSTVANAYGSITDSGGGTQIPWTTDWVRWDISLQRWVSYGEK